MSQKSKTEGEPTSLVSSEHASTIRREVGGQIQYNDVIDDFAARKARRTAL